MCILLKIILSIHQAVCWFIICSVFWIQRKLNDRRVCDNKPSSFFQVTNTLLDKKRFLLLFILNAKHRPQQFIVQSRSDLVSHSNVQHIWGKIYCLPIRPRFLPQCHVFPIHTDDTVLLQTCKTFLVLVPSQSFSLPICSLYSVFSFTHNLNNTGSFQNCFYPFHLSKTMESLASSGTLL